MRIVLGDDHTLMRQGLRKILEDHGDWKVVAEAGDGREAVKQTLATQPDLAIFDIGMPLLNGIEATRQVVRRLPDVCVLILSMHADEAYVIKAVQAGARGYLLKDSADTDLIRVVEAVAAGKSFFSPAVASVMVDDYVRRMADQGVADRYDLLSEREREVFQLLPKATATRGSPRFCRSARPRSRRTAHIFFRNWASTTPLSLSCTPFGAASSPSPARQFHDRPAAVARQWPRGATVVRLTKFCPDA